MYEGQTYDVVLNRMLSRVSSKYDKRESSVIYTAVAPAALEISEQYKAFDWMLRELSPETSSREFLVILAAQRGIKPYEASSAVVKIDITPADYELPLGARFSAANNDYNYEIIEKLEDGSYKASCEMTGSEPNIYTGIALPIDYLSGLQSAQVSEILIYGADEEDEESLLERYLDSFEEQAFGGNRKDYINKVESIAGVGACKVKRVWNGDISPADMIPNANVTNWYNSIISTLSSDVKAWLTAIYTAAIEKKLTTGGTVLVTILDAQHKKANKTLLELVQEILDPSEMSGEGRGLAPIGHVVNVKTAEEVQVNITFSLVFDSGYSWDSCGSLVIDTIEQYLSEIRSSWKNQNSTIVRISLIESRIVGKDGVEGILDISGTMINGQASNLVIGEYEIPVLGGVVNE